jgi:hypothetical protein
MALEDFLDKERTGGKTVGGEAAFTLDPVKVRERVAVFCREESLYPLLRCLQALIRVSRTDIFGLKKGDLDWEFRFRWDRCPPTRAFEQLLNLGTTAGFDEVGHGVGQHFFFGMSAALGTEHYKLSWCGPQAHFELRKGEVIVKEPVPDEYTTLTLSVESSWWQKLARGSAFRNEEEDLEYRLSYSPKTIHLNGKRLIPEAPQAPDRPWAARLAEGSELAWRFIRKADKNLLTVPYPELDYYRSVKGGEAFHLIREAGGKRLPLSVFIDDPDRKKLKRGQTHNLSLSQSNRAQTALFLSLDAGRHDWLLPVHDGVLCPPMEVDISGGGIVCLTSVTSLQYDLSGQKVVENDAFHDFRRSMKRESRALKKQLAVSLANIGLRADQLPKNYEQALGYLTGGPYLGFLSGRVGPRLRRFFSRGTP